MPRTRASQPAKSPAPTAPGPRPTPPAPPTADLVAASKPETPPTPEKPRTVADMLEDALRRLVLASPVDIVGAPGLTGAKLVEYTEARAKAQELLDIVAFGR